MTPLMRDDERAFDVEQVAFDERLEKERIGHAGDRGGPEIQIEDRPLRPRRHRRPGRPEFSGRARERGGKRRIAIAL